MDGVGIHMVMENCHRILKLRAYLKRICYPSVGAKADGTKTTLEIFSTEGICLKDGMQKKMQGLHLELEQNKDISWIQTFHAATQEGTDSGAYYCVTKVGSDIDNQGMNFMPSITQLRSLFCLKVGDNLSPNSKHIQN